jgi:hypothetical protein
MCAKLRVVRVMAFHIRDARIRHGLRSIRTGSVLPVAAFVLAAATLAGCGSDGMSSVLVDPARYNGYRCSDLVGQWKTLVAREKELRNLMDKANEGGGGAIIGTLTYRSDYQTVLEQEKVLQRTAAGEKCQLMPASTSTYTSDQTIR